MTQDTTYIAIVDDDAIYRIFAKNRISEMPNCMVILEASDGSKLIEKIEQSKIIPDICVLDLCMPVMDGYEAIKILNKRWPAIKTLVVSQYCQNYAIESMISLGARGFISKEEMLQSLPEAIHSIIQTGFFYSRMVGEELFSEAEKSKFKHIQLTSVEQEILILLCKDLQYDEIAKSLFKSKHTIEKHKQNISKKLGIFSREGLILFAMKNEIFILE